MDLSREQVVSLFLTLTLLISIPFFLLGFEETTRLFSRARYQPAEIVVDAGSVTGPLPHVWRAIAQGGEEADRMFFSVRDELIELSPRYVRIDHLYDFYNVVEDSEGRLVYDWSRLDQTVRDIISTGAKPFFALSYMPPALSEDGTVLGKPADWSDWERLVRATIERYSGRTGMNIADVYYEVWNEPDYFGNWKTYGDKNYLMLYYYAERGAAGARNTGRFFFGGPATTGLYRNWIQQLISFVEKENLRLDFLSWHRYAQNSQQYSYDIANLEHWLSAYPDKSRLPRVISEFGFDSEMNPAHDSRLAAAHTAAVIREIIPDVEMAFTFELKDGASPTGERFWGRWGLVTHDSTGNVKKPRYFTLKLLNNLGNHRLWLSGESEYIKAIATTENSTVSLLLVNYDPQSKHLESVPLTFTNLADSRYRLDKTDIAGNESSDVLEARSGKITIETAMEPNNVVLVQLVPID